jgi:SNF2 family DNA or RNA helicase
MSLTLMKHQEEALDFLRDRKHAGLFFEMGLGKTVTILSHLKSLSSPGELADSPLPTLIISPLSVVTVWEREISHFNFPFTFSALTGTKEERLEALQKNADIYAINYEGLRVSGMKQALLEKNFRCIILDESHRAKERSALQTQICIELAANIPYRYILTGTPITKSPEDIWSQLHLLKPGYLGNFYSFRNQHVEFKSLTVRSKNGLIEIKKPYRFKNLDRSNDPKIVPLKHKMDYLCLRKTKAECLDLPEKIYKTIYCHMEGAQKKAYYDLKVGLQGEFDNKTLTIRSATTLVQKLRQICQGFLYHAENETKYFKQNCKIEMLKDLLEDISQADLEGNPAKIIIFTNYIAEIEMLKSALEDYPVLVYDGTAQERQAIVDQFQRCQGSMIFLANIEKAKEGITLTAAHHVIYFSNSYNYGSRSQSEDRAHRTGQKNTVIYYDLVCPGTIDEKVTWLLKNKKTMADKVTGDAMRLAKLALEIEENDYDAA